MGKSALAARHFADASYPVMAWLDTRLGLTTELISLATALGLDERPDPAETVAGLVSWLRDTDAPWLLVIDDAGSPSDLGPLLAVRGRGRVIVTSRHAEWPVAADVVPVEIFSAGEAARLLQAVSRRSEDPDAEPLAHHLGGLALALSLVGSWCHEQQMSFAVCLEHLRGAGAGRTDDVELDDIGALPRILSSAIDFARHRSSTADALLRVLAHLDWGATSRTWLRQGLTAVDAFASSGALDEILEALSAFHLVRVERGMISLAHRSIVEQVRGTLTLSARSQTHAALYRLFDGTLPDPARHLSVLRSTRAEAEAIHHLCAVVVSAPATEVPDTFEPLLSRAVGQLLAEADYARCIPLARAAATLAARSHGHHDDDVLAARALEAFLHWRVGQFSEAIDIEEGVLAQRARQRGDDHLDTVNARANLAHSYYSAGRARDALALRRRVLHDRQRILGPDHPDTITARADLAHSSQATGRNDEAIEFRKRVGMAWAHAPELGTFTAPCDNRGNVLIVATELRELVGAADDLG